MPVGGGLQDSANLRPPEAPRAPALTPSSQHSELIRQREKEGKAGQDLVGDRRFQSCLPSKRLGAAPTAQRSQMSTPNLAGHAKEGRQPQRWPPPHQSVASGRDWPPSSCWEVARGLSHVPPGSLLSESPNHSWWQTCHCGREGRGCVLFQRLSPTRGMNLPPRGCHLSSLSVGLLGC